MNRRGFFSRLAGVALLPALARMRSAPVRPVLVIPWPLPGRSPRQIDPHFWPTRDPIGIPYWIVKNKSL